MSAGLSGFFHLATKAVAKLRGQLIQFINTWVVVLLTLLFGGVITGGVAGISCAEEIRIYNWENYLSAEVIESFTHLTGHRVRQFYFDDEGVRDSVISTGRGSGFDLVLVDSMTLQVMADQNRFVNLKEITANVAEHIDPQWLNSCGDFGVPYAWGTMGILYRSSLGTSPITSWLQLFDPPEQHRGRVVMYLDKIDAPAAALLAAGANPFSREEFELRQAHALFQKQRPYLLAQAYGAGYAQEHETASHMSLTLGYSGDLHILQNATGQDDWNYVIPDEGTVLWVECWAVPTGRQVNIAAGEFLSFINQPRIAAENAESIWVATANRTAVPLTSNEYREDPMLFPPADILRKSHPYQRIDGNALRLRNRIINSLQ